MKTAIVIGAGVSGLAAAWKLRKEGTEVLVLESRDSPGGVMVGENVDGFCVELGPSEMMLKDAQMEELIREMGVHEELLFPGKSGDKRYIVRNGKPVALPENLLKGALNPILNIWGKLGLATEVFQPRSNLDDESVSHFVKRRIGEDFLNYAVGPLVSGIYAGDPDLLSMRHAFPALWNLEKQYGGMVRGAIGKMLERRKNKSNPTPYKRSLVSFKGGMRTLPATIAQSMQGCIECSSTVTSIRQEKGLWKVHWKRKDIEHIKCAHMLVLAVPAWALNKLPLVDPLLDAVGPISKLPYSPVSLVFSGYRREDIKHPLDGFGMLIPQKEMRGVIGTLFLSSLFEGRAPEGHVALLSFVGGMYAKNYASMPEDAQRALVREELERLLGANGGPVIERSHHWPMAIPNFPVGYQSTLDALDRIEERWKGLAIIGNYRGGPAAGDSLVQGVKRAGRLLEKTA